MRPLCLAVLVLSLWPFLARAEAAPCAPDSHVTVRQGDLCGAVSPRSDRVLVYKGVPYAKPPVPAQGLRWRPPQPPENWHGERQALAFGAICPQQVGNALQGAEDCLYLNVWAPRRTSSQPADLPVMVFLHGGGFTAGAGSLASYDGSVLAEQGQAVVVTVNYRLGALGFLFADHAPGGALPQPVPGNLGLMDQLAALEWVKANATAFGGSPDKVVVFGESAGAMSAGLHLFSVPQAIPLFRAAIMESNPLGVVYPDRRQASRQGQSFLRHLCGIKVRPADCHPTPADLQSYSLAQVFRASGAYEAERMVSEADAGFPQSMPWGPLVDGHLVTAQPMNGYGRDNVVAPKPFVFGVNANEGVAFAAMTCAAFASNDAGPNPDPREAAQCLPVGATASMMSPQWYDGAITQLYGKTGAAQVRAFTASHGGKPYDAQSLPGTSYYNAAAQAMAAVVADDNFVCANLRLAQRVAKQVPAQRMHAYLFSQPPLFDLYASMGTQACSPANGQVCHGDELAFVFGTLAVTSAEFGGTLPVPAADQAVSDSMVRAWTDFARDLTMGDHWPAFTDGGMVRRLAANGTRLLAGGELAAAAHCPQLWDRPRSRN
ncbi:MAG: carboxylesterase family protein [Magnetospirillum sp.]|nr:carboxylesterase family protein [Magnetospirillum sp.]